MFNNGVAFFSYNMQSPGYNGEEYEFMQHFDNYRIFIEKSPNEMDEEKEEVEVNCIYKIERIRQVICVV